MSLGRLTPGRRMATLNYAMKLFSVALTALVLASCGGETRGVSTPDAGADVRDASPDTTACCGPHLDDSELEALCCLELGLSETCCSQ